MRLWLIRHPRPDIAGGVCYGQADLAPAAGEIERVLAALAGRLPAAPLWASPLLRCRLLAEQLAPGRVHYDARLMEMHFGTWELCRWDDIDRAAIDAWAAAPATYRPGGAESLAGMAQRLADWVAELAAAGEQQEVVVVCHAGSMRLLAMLARGLSPQDAAQEAATVQHTIDYGALRVVDFPIQGAAHG
jgi:alpha-ribazole phosphatase